MKVIENELEVWSQESPSDTAEGNKLRRAIRPCRLASALGLDRLDPEPLNWWMEAHTEYVIPQPAAVARTQSQPANANPPGGFNFSQITQPPWSPPPGPMEKSQPAKPQPAKSAHPVRCKSSNSPSLRKPA